MTAYHFTRSMQLSPEVAARKAARKKVIQRAQEVERKSYLALKKKTRLLHSKTQEQIV
jgi:hypothetical protein